VGATSGKQSRVEVTDVLGGVLRVALYLICKVDERSMDGYSMSLAGAAAREMTLIANPKEG
jgi:hypothetical protein